jgi:hypothetical protein
MIRRRGLLRRRCLKRFARSRHYPSESSKWEEDMVSRHTDGFSPFL